MPPSRIDFKPVEQLMQTMDILIEFLKALPRKANFISKSQQAQIRPIALENSILATVPAEIINSIIQLLPPEAAASFSISCRQIFLLLGTRFIKDLASHDLQEAKLSFLTTLERDLPGYIVCIPCNKLHRIQDAEHYIVSQIQGFSRLEACLENDRQKQVSWWIGHNASSTVLKMALKQHRLSGNDLKTCHLLRLMCYSELYLRDDHFSLQMKTECRIKNRTMFMRQQKQITIHRELIQLVLHHQLCPHMLLQSWQGSANISVKTGSYWVGETEQFVSLSSKSGNHA